MAYKLNRKLVDLVPYEPIKGHYNIRLDANESFFNLPDSLKEKICTTISKLDFNRYPDCLAEAPNKSFASLYGISPDSVSSGNGSDELISIITCCFFEAGDTLVNVSNDFSMYEFYAQLSDIKVKTYQKEEDLTIDPDKLINFCRENKASGLIFSNPCNPTSLGLDRESVRKIITSLEDCLVILDEAYMDFWDQAILPEADRYSNLIVLKTCSKALGLASVRFGFAVANPTITTAIRAAKSPYNNDSVSQAIVSDILSEKKYLNECRDAIIKNTRALYSEILRVNLEYRCFEKVYEPCTNFVFIRTDKAEDIYSFMLENSIAVRKFKGHLRITAGSEEENSTFIEVLEKYLKK